MPRNINRLEAVGTIGIDIGKNTFHLVGLDRACLIGMEPCVGAHHLSRQLKAYGHDARLAR
jgi:transposase